MDEASIRSLLDEFGQAWNNHDLDAALALATDDVVFESTGPAPDGTRADGRVAVRAAWEPIFADASSRFDVEELFIANDRAAQRWTYTWGDGHIRGVDVFLVRDGKVAEKLSYVKG